MNIILHICFFLVFRIAGELCTHINIILNINFLSLIIQVCFLGRFNFSKRGIQKIQTLFYHAEEKNLYKTKKQITSSENRHREKHVPS